MDSHGIFHRVIALPAYIAGTNMKWLRGITWDEIGKNGVLRHTTSLKGEVVERNLSESPMVMAELRSHRDAHGSLPRNGPVIVYEKSKKPYVTFQFRREWRMIADAVGVPKNVKNMDSAVMTRRQLRRPTAAQLEDNPRLNRRRLVAWGSQAREIHHDDARPKYLACHRLNAFGAARSSSRESYDPARFSKGCRVLARFCCVVCLVRSDFCLPKTTLTDQFGSGGQKRHIQTRPLPFS
jgi:hypothetical protein